MRTPLACIVAILLGPSMALAQGTPLEPGAQPEADPFAVPPPPMDDTSAGEHDMRSAAADSTVGLDLTFMYKEVDIGLAGDLKVLSLSPVLRAFFMVTDMVGIGVDWGFLSFANFKIGDMSEQGIFPGNPFAGGFYVHAFDGLLLRAGGGVGLPLSAASDDTEGSLAGLLANATHGLYDPWLWLEDTLSFVAEGDLEGVVGPDVYVGAELALAIFVPVRDRDFRDTEVGIQFAIEGGFDTGTVTPGIRLQGAWLASADGDNFQLSLVPFVRVDLGGGYFHAHLLMNLDDPFGFAFDDEGIYGLMLGGGAVL